jgi:methionyl-tRNA formyltransferase
MRIIFMGTPEFAVPSLKTLHEFGYEIVAVVTVPDKPAGRGRKLRPSAVKEYALAHDLPILQPVKLRDPAFVSSLQDLRPDLMVVVAFRMLPKMVWEIPRMGTFNLHASLLPDYRGAAPINWVLINGERETGLTTFLIDEKIDTGNILLQEKVEIPTSWNAGDLHDHMMEKGSRLVLKTAQELDGARLIPHKQDESLYRHKAPKIQKEDCRIDWSRSSVEVYNHIRGLSPYPTAWTTLAGQGVKVFQAQPEEGLDFEGEAGQIHLIDGRLWVQCGLGSVELNGNTVGREKTHAHDRLFERLQRRTQSI